MPHGAHTPEHIQFKQSLFSSRFSSFASLHFLPSILRHLSLFLPSSLNMLRDADPLPSSLPAGPRKCRQRKQVAVRTSRNIVLNRNSSEWFGITFGCRNARWTSQVHLRSMRRIQANQSEGIKAKWMEVKELRRRNQSKGIKETEGIKLWGNQSEKESNGEVSMPG